MDKDTPSTSFYLWAIIYFVLTTLLKWRLKFDISIGFYAVGAIIGTHLLDVLEKVMKVTRATFRNVVAQALITVLTFFVLTSSVNRLGAGVVLFLNLRLLYLQKKEYRQTGHLSNFAVAGVNEKLYLNILLILFVLETVLFVLI